jgi:hypothetical protein
MKPLFEQVLREATSSFYQKWAIFKSDEKTKQYFFISNTNGSLADVYYTWSTNQKFADPSYIIAPVNETNKYLIKNEQEASQAAAQVTQYALTLTKKIQRGTKITPKTYMSLWGSGLEDRQRQKNDNLIKDRPLTPPGGQSAID